jgi:hypothetical protein
MYKRIATYADAIERKEEQRKGVVSMPGKLAPFFRPQVFEGNTFYCRVFPGQTPGKDFMDHKRKNFSFLL